MSGPKGGSYRVETAVQREARQLRDAQAEYARAESHWRAAQSAVAAVAATTGASIEATRPAAVPVDADSAAYRRATAELQAAVAAAVALAAAAREESAAKAFAMQMERLIKRTGDAEPEPTAGRPTRWQRSRSDVEAVGESVLDPVNGVATQARVQRRLTELAQLKHDTTRVQVLIADILNAGSSARCDLLMSELDYLIADARAVAERERATESALAELRAMSCRLAGIESGLADSARKRIAELIAGQPVTVPVSLAEHVQAAVTEADAAADRQHVVTAMREALEKLGYATGPEFSTELSGAQGTAFASGTDSLYGVKVRLEPGSNRFSAQPVRPDDVLTTTEEDVAAEHEFCGAFDRMTDLLREHGVLLAADIRTPPGRSQVQEVAAHRLVRTIGRKRRDAAHKEIRHS